MDFTILGWCPHVLTEHRKEAELYCDICAPQVIMTLRKEAERDGIMLKLLWDENTRLHKIITDESERHSVFKDYYGDCGCPLCRVCREWKELRR